MERIGKIFLSKENRKEEEIKSWNHRIAVPQFLPSLLHLLDLSAHFVVAEHRRVRFCASRSFCFHCCPQTTFADHAFYITSHCSEMSTGELLSIEPLELKFPFELKKQISCSIQLSNKTDNYVAFKVKTTNPKKYCVRPNTGVVLPRSTCDVIVTMQAQKDAPPDMQCKDKFLLQSVKANDGITPKDITAEMFNKEAGHVVEECKLRVVYVSPPQPPSPVPEGSEEGSSPRASVSENGNANNTDFSTVAKAFTERPEAQDKSAEGKALISRLTEEKNNALQLNSKLRQELELLRREGNKNRGGVSIMFVILVGLLGIVMGYLMKKT